MDSLSDFKEKVREANPIEEVIPWLGFPLRVRGGRADGDRDDCNTLHVLINMQHAWWYGDDNWHGDVFAFVQKVKGCDFMRALEILADRAGLRMPEFKKEDASEVQRRSATADAFVVAASVFHRWLMGYEDKSFGVSIAADAAALDYVRGRAWTDETIRAELVGFSGRKEKWQFDDMRGEFSKFGIDPFSPAAVAVLGFSGDVRGWADKYSLLDHPDFDKGWVEAGHISGLMSAPGVIYAHKRFGKVDYLSRRQLPGFDVITDFKTQKQRPWKSYNPNRCLVGGKQFYYNAKYDLGKLCIMCEGQGDAVTWGQLGYGSVALLGALSDFERKTPEEQEVTLQWVRRMWKHNGLFYAPDDDEQGQKNVKLIGRIFGPKIQILRMIRLVSREDARSVEDVNVEA